MKATTLGDISSFLDWKLDQKRGKNGRKLRGTTIDTSLETYWKQFRLVHERATGKKLGGQTTRQMHKANTIPLTWTLTHMLFKELGAKGAGKKAWVKQHKAGEIPYGCREIKRGPANSADDDGYAA